jgi:hypothetical protein
VHYPDPLGLKGDQLNYAAACCAGMLLDGVPPSQAFLVCYDADSRPPVDSLARFTQAIAGNPGADVFHQSSRFEFRPPPRAAAGPVRRLRAAVCSAGALRANRFVLGFEIPRLVNRSARAGLRYDVPAGLRGTRNRRHPELGPAAGRRVRGRENRTRSPQMIAGACIVALEGPCCAGKTTLGHLPVRDLRGLTVTLVTRTSTLPSARISGGSPAGKPACGLA